MARKSRKAGAPAGGAPQPKARACRMGVYARTSKAYGDDGCSIANQRRIVADHVSKLGDAVVAEYYVDDGFTGTNQDRDAFQRMLGDLRSGRIDGVAAKDASRLGRDYIECQTLIRDTLPSLGARLVLVSDGVDSKDDAAMEGMALDLRSLLNDLYSRDLSRKIHATFDAARRRGPLVLGNVPYGYARDEEDKHHLVPDPATAPFVRAMFRMSAQGESNAKIADWLNEQGAPTAGQAKYGRAGLKPTSRDSARWLARNVNRVLDNPVYAGDVVMNKWTQQLYLGVPHTENDPEDWDIVEGAHEPLVSKEVFSFLQARRRERVEARRAAVAASERARRQRPDRLAGKVWCGECGAPMHICRWVEDGVVWGAEYCCGNKDRGKGGGRHRMAAPLLETLCMDVMRAQLKAAADLDATLERLTSSGRLAERARELDARIAEAEEALSFVESECARLKAEHTALEVSTQEYKRISKALRARRADASAELARLAAQREDVRGLAGAGPLAGEVAAKATGSFSAELADALIDRVTVGADGSVEVALRLEDPFARRRRALEAVG